MVLTAEGAALLLIDLQERLMPVIADQEAVVTRAVRLAEAATLLDVPVLATEQHPKGLGPTVPPLAGYPQRVMTKTAFSAAGDPGFAELLLVGAGQGVVAGVEAHVCVLQTVLDLLAAGRTGGRGGGRARRGGGGGVAGAAYPAGSGAPPARTAPIEGARQHGAEIVTSEMV